MSKPLVSVITITRNRGKLLGRCIASVLGQTYENIEYFVVDGASEDNTDEVVSSFQDNRLKYVKLETNWPIKETIDYGISLCKGKYISFLDSDDEYLPQKIEKQVRLIESLPEEYGFVYCWMSYYDSITGNLLSIHNPELRGFVPDEVVGTSTISGTPSLLFRAESLRELGGWKSPEEIGIISDWELCARACQKYKIDYIAESLINVYVNHCFTRQSQIAYYGNKVDKFIVFHEYMLNTYKGVFLRHHKYGREHYLMLTRFYSIEKKRRKALFYYKMYLKTLPPLFAVFKPLAGIILCK